MKGYFSTVVVFLLGLLIGFGSFLVIHTNQPDVFHNENPEVAAPWRPKNLQTDLPEGELGAQIKYGYELITATNKHIGPLALDSSMRFAGNNLTCNNCHLNGGRKIGSGSFIGVYNRFPQFRGRENKIGTLEERIQGCMERSMAGQRLPPDGEEMKAMVAYMQWLSDGVPEDMDAVYKGYVKIDIPSFRAEPAIGKELYEVNCSRCHLSNGLGTLIPGEEFTGYIFPPLAGDDSFNDGAGMNRVLTAAQFIKGNMPLGATHDSPLLSDEQAYHIAAYINTFSRPTKANREADFPDKKLKPVSTPYEPWADHFSAEQHKFGPFPPIIDYYEKEFGITKTK